MSIEKAKTITEARVRNLLGLKDLTDPENGVSPINILLLRVQENLVRNGINNNNVRIVRGNPVVSIENNFDILGFPADSVMRGGIHTLSTGEGKVLRTQMSTTAVEYFRDSRTTEEGVFLFPGVVYRREGVHHQLDVWTVQRRTSEPALTVHGLMNLVLSPCLNEGTQIKIGTKELCYITGGIKAKVPIRDGYGTVFDGGEVTADVLERIGIDSARYRVLAAGVSLERLAMMAKGIDDPRLFRSTDRRVVSQMKDLEPYPPVSFMPSISRDLSVPVATNITLGDVDILVRTHTREGLVESVEIVSETPYDLVPDPAKQRLGIRPEEKNLLVRVTLRSFERTLKREEANSVRQTLFEVLDHCSQQTLAELADMPQTR